MHGQSKRSMSQRPTAPELESAAASSVLLSEDKDASAPLEEDLSASALFVDLEEDLENVLRDFAFEFAMLSTV